MDNRYEFLYFENEFELEREANKMENKKLVSITKETDGDKLVGFFEKENVWHKYPDEKPPYKKDVLCYTDKGRYVILKYIKYILTDGTIKEEGWWDSRYGNNVIAWTKLPEPPNF